ncbi:hypothetical protein Gogos_019152 [Gossypium gossypioides]|uniref:DUF4283 domain-containing protein n=1 Tax=Gossypium gossypioides TaxID=34282 RepID=A0A7J9BGK2_GOSGO|nr:hypothetical protein [Gossypium gossypioides]
MENELANLSLDNGEEDVLLIPNESGSQSVGEKSNLVWCFLTASIVHFLAMKNTMANVWHPIRVQTSNLGDKRFYFSFFHKMDMDRVISGVPWTFNNHLLVVHRLENGEDPIKVPLVFVNFWVQVHELAMGLFSKIVARQLGDCIEKFLKYDSKSLSKGVKNFLQIKVWLDARRPLKQNKKIMFAFRNYTYVSFKYERLTMFLLSWSYRHNNSYQIMMSKGEELVELGWDLSFRAQSRQAVEMYSVWLIEEGDGGLRVTFGTRF